MAGKPLRLKFKLGVFYFIPTPLEDAIPEVPENVNSSCPSPAEIRKRCKQIQREWTEDMEKSRRITGKPKTSEIREFQWVRSSRDSYLNHKD